VIEKTDWPVLSDFQLSPEEMQERRSYLGGSDANLLLSGDEQKVRDLWAEKRGERVAKDLSEYLPVQLGCWTEAFNRQWFERLSGDRVTRLGEKFVSATDDWRRCSVDGTVERTEAVWEAKHTSAFAKPEEVLQRYMPQLQHNMAVAGRDRAVLSVIFGNHKFEIMEVAADWLYQLELLEAEEQFWDCVITGKVPVPVTPPTAPRPIGTREVCLEGNNAWASAAFDWLQHREAAKAHAASVTLIKSLVEEDVGRAFGHGIEAKRSKAGAITIRELVQ
jgi:predicted phage-related endonuclease